MRNNITKVFISIIFYYLIVFSSQAQSGQPLTVPGDISKWISSTFAKGKIPPFSFVYNEKTSASFIKKWNYSFIKETNNDPRVIRYRVSYTDPVTGLKVDAHIRGFQNFKTVEWMLNFTNTTVKNSPVIEEVKVVDLTLMSEKEGAFYLHHARGSNAKRSDFQPMSTMLIKGKSIHMQPAGGRSSDETGFPFFTIESPDNTGIVSAIGWSGTWFSDIEQSGSKAINIKAGMAGIKLFLLPGETIRTPSFCMLFWHDRDRMEGQNQFRRFILAHHSRKINGKLAEYPLSGGFNWGDPAPCNEYSCLTEDYACAIINRYKQFGITPEVFWLDAGWYTGCGSWHRNVGNWTVDTTRFPNGLKPVADAAHRVGAKFMVWFEPERVYRNTQLAKEHSEWILTGPDDGENYIFDLGNPDARKWLQQYIGDFIETNGIDYYRQDFNIRPAAYWTMNDEPGRSGMKEIRHIEGLYAFWDYLLERFPNLLIDNCASGGRRLDLETISRSAPLWRTDYQYGEPNGYQCHTYGLNFFIPLSGTGMSYADPYSFTSSIGSAVVLNWKLTNPDMSIPDMQECVKRFKELRPYFYEDYYPLTGISDLTGDDVWLAYQLNKPSDNSGIIVAFRRKDNKSDTLSVKLQGLNQESIYSVFDNNNVRMVTKSGKNLAEGLTLHIPEAPGALILKYQPGVKVDFFY